MELSALTALSPLDGRYRAKVVPLAPYFSEYALIRYRVQIEIAWLQALSREPGIAELAPFHRATTDELDAVAAGFSVADAEAVKAIEVRTNHDVKAVEYWLRERLAANPEVARNAQFIHFACTSEDINNLCHGLMLSQSRAAVLLPALDAVIAKLRTMAHALADAAMLARTHGQAATPTTLGKELANVVARLVRHRERRDELVNDTYFSGDGGCYGAVHDSRSACPCCGTKPRWRLPRFPE